MDMDNDNDNDTDTYNFLHHTYSTKTTPQTVRIQPLHSGVYRTILAMHAERLAVN